MTLPVSYEDHQSRRPRHLLVMAAGGLLIMGGLGVARLSLSPPMSPGKLVARQELMTWQSPVQKSFHPLGPNEAQGRFELENVGGSPVHILEVQTSCGCATPEVQPTTIAPGKTGTVVVRAVPLHIGERMVSITLNTDSPSSPKVVLQLRIVGSRRAPFMGRAYGELNYLVGSSMSEGRKIFADAIESSGSIPSPPIARTEMPFLEISNPTLESEAPHTLPGTIRRRYVYEVTLASKVPSGRFVGEVTVTDPWDTDHVERVRVHGEYLPPIRAVPSRSVIRVGAGRRDGEPTAKITILSTSSAPDLAAELERNQETPLIIDRLKMTKDGRLGIFTVSLKPGATRAGIYNVLVGRPSSSERIIVPVAVLVEDDQ